ncbi:MAG: pyridoxamine 5'-phosphate oxidase family protein [bacterium]|nr:pyridoxamine 5'-phosphate oxidase family protein [bacterium]
MRRHDREITDFDEMVEVMRRCDVCRLAFQNGEVPYIVPLNFGMQVQGKDITLFFHGALEGTKYEVMKRHPRAAFEMDCAHRLVLDDEKHSCTMEYESVIGSGTVSLLNEDEKYEALLCLMRQYHSEDFPFNKDMMAVTNVFCLRVESMTGKRRKKGNGDRQKLDEMMSERE